MNVKNKEMEAKGIMTIIEIIAIIIIGALVVVTLIGEGSIIGSLSVFDDNSEYYEHYSSRKKSVDTANRLIEANQVTLALPHIDDALASTEKMKEIAKTDEEKEFAELSLDYLTTWKKILVSGKSNNFNELFKSFQEKEKKLEDFRKKHPFFNNRLSQATDKNK